MTHPPYPARRRRATGRGVLIGMALLFGTAAPARGNEPPGLPYAVTVTAPGDLAALAGSVAQAATLAERAPTDALGLIGRVRGDLPRLQDMLRAEGYWGGSVTATIAGRDPADPALPALLENARGPVPVAFVLTPGERYVLGRIGLAAEPPEAAEAARDAAAGAGVTAGSPARAATVSAAEAAMLDALRRAGHPLAGIADRTILVDHDRRAMDIAWRLAPGPRATFARPTVSGLVRTRAGLVERRAARRIEGRDYSPATLEAGRRALLALGVFDAVRAEPGRAIAADGRLPVHYAVSERPLRAIGGTLAWETNDGVAASLYWEHRNLFGGAERLRLEAEGTRLGESSFGDATYRAFATLTLPEIWRQEARLAARIGAVRERLDAYDRDAALFSAIAEHAWTERIALQAGPLYEEGRIGRQGVFDDVSLAGFVGGIRWDGTASLLDPTAGQRASLTVTPFHSLRDGMSFTRILATGSAYLDVTGDARGVLALRGAVGATIGATRDGITFDKRFYAGGGGSVRGFTFQSIGPRDAANRPLGGASLLETSIEWRQRITGPWGAVAFVDAGAVGEDSIPGSGDLRVGVGAGLRYRTAIGPIRIDGGVPLNRQPGDPAYALYVGIGQAF